MTKLITLVGIFNLIKFATARLVTDGAITFEQIYLLLRADRF